MLFMQQNVHRWGMFRNLSGLGTTPRKARGPPVARRHGKLGEVQECTRRENEDALHRMRT